MKTLNDLVDEMIKRRDCEHCYRFLGLNMYTKMPAEIVYICVKCYKEKAVSVSKRTP